jgi:hypothetical protein
MLCINHALDQMDKVKEEKELYFFLGIVLKGLLTTFRGIKKN